MNKYLIWEPGKNQLICQDIVSENLCKKELKLMLNVLWIHMWSFLKSALSSINNNLEFKNFQKLYQQEKFPEILECFVIDIL